MDVVHRAVTKLSVCQIYANVSGRELSSYKVLYSTFLLFPLKVARDGADHTTQGKSLPLQFGDSPVNMLKCML